MLDAGEGGRACAAIVTTDENDVGVCLGHSGGYGTDSNFRHQLDADAGVMVCVLKIVYQLAQVFD